MISLRFDPATIVSPPPDADPDDDDAWMLSSWAIRHPVEVLTAMWDLVEIPPDDADMVLEVNATATAQVRKVNSPHLYFWWVVQAQAQAIAALCGLDVTDDARRIIHAAAIEAHGIQEGTTS